MTARKKLILLLLLLLGTMLLYFAVFCGRNKPEIKNTLVFYLPGKDVPPLKLRRIPPGKFMMGAPDTEPGNCEKYYRTEFVNYEFWMGIYEVTQKQWEALKMPNYSLQYAPDNPVETVGYYQILEYCQQLNRLYADKLPRGYKFYLPSDIEWEYACRAGTATGLNSGKNLTGESENHRDSNLDELGWYKMNSPDEKHHPVGLKKPNAWGLYDMHGNVREWTRSWGFSFYCGIKRIRGGGFLDEAAACRSAKTFRIGSRGATDDLGFRIALVRECDIASNEAVKIRDSEEFIDIRRKKL